MKKICKYLTPTFVIVFLISIVNVGPFEGLAVTQTQATQKKTTNVKYYTIRAGKIMRVRLDQQISSENGRVGDTFTGTIVDPIHSSSGVQVVPAGSKIAGKITGVQKAQKDGNPGVLSVYFNKIELPNGRTKTISGSLADLETDKAHANEEGHVSGNKTSKRNLKWIGGGAGGGAVIGAIAGGGKGLLIGGAAGAVGGLIGKKLTKGKEAVIKEGTEFGVYLNTTISLPAYR